MGKDGKRIEFLTTINRDQAAFYLAELAKSLLHDRIVVRMGREELIMSPFEEIHVEIAAREKRKENKLEIKLSWKKPHGV